MTEKIPPCPNCGGILRPNYAGDTARCRCGFEVDGEVLMAMNFRSFATPAEHTEHLKSRGRFIKPPDIAPGIYVTTDLDGYSKLAGMVWDARCVNRGHIGESSGMIAVSAVVEGMRLGLRPQPEQPRGVSFVIESPAGSGVRRSLMRETVYGVAPFDRVCEAARQMVRAIVALRGPGRWWALLDPVHVISDDGMARIGDIGGVPHVLLRAIYCHDPDAPAAVVKTPVGDITIKSDSTLGPDEMRVGKAAPPGTALREYRDRMEQLQEARLPGLMAAVEERNRMAVDAIALQAQLLTRTEVCPVCRRALKLTSVASGKQACSDPTCKAAHGYPRYGAPGGCCGHARICDAPNGHLPSCLRYRAEPIDPLDVEYDGVKLRQLLFTDRGLRRGNVVTPEGGPPFLAEAPAWMLAQKHAKFTPAQRAVVSAHWSAQLRAKVAASTAADKERDRLQVVIGVDAEDLPW